MSRASVQHLHLGRIRYALASERQHARWDDVREERASEAIFTLEHDPVITLGRRGNEADIRLSPEVLSARGIDVVRTDRGGQVTYHGPGQLVIYPVLAVRDRGIHAGDLVRGVAACVQRCLARLDIHAAYDTDAPGLWVNGAKIAAVGMRISRGVSMHGVAINLTTELSAFDIFVPCGMPDARATSVAEQLVDSARPVPPLRDFGREVVDELAAHFSLSITREDAEAPLSPPNLSASTEPE